MLRDGLVAIVKRECPTCDLVRPVLRELDGRASPFRIAVQDEPAAFDGLGTVVDDTALELSFRYGVDVVPTLVRVRDGVETGRAVGWNRDAWRSLAGDGALGDGLPDQRPGCGSRTRDPGMPAKLQVRYGATGLTSREVEIPSEIDPVEACFDRGWTDGLPVVPPTRERVLEMLAGTSRAATDVICNVPPNLVPCTVEKAAINAVLAGCRPEYFPVVIAAIETAMNVPGFNLHAVLATTNAVAPVLMVNGPIARAIGMNAGFNVFGQGNRANATIGRAFQLIVRNVGGGRPGEVDRSVFGSAGKYTFCFAEDESDPRWETYAESAGFTREQSTVTVFSGDGNTPVIDHTSRTPEDLCASLANGLRAVYQPGHVIGVQAMLAVGFEHQQVFYEAGWSKQRVRDELEARLQIAVRDLVPGRGGLDGITPAERANPDALVPKYRSGPLNVIRAGGRAGKYSAIISSIGGWKSIRPVTGEIRP
jgi:hypothetical protein